MSEYLNRRWLGRLLVIALFDVGLSLAASAQPSPATTPAPPSSSTPKSADQVKPAPSTPETSSPPSATPPATGAAPTKPDDKTLAPQGKPNDTEIEPNAAPGIPDNATTENVDVPSRTLVFVNGSSSYDEAFKSIRASLEIVRTAMEKAGLKPSGHPITIFSAPDDKGFKYKAGYPIAKKPEGTPNLGSDVTIGESPAGKAIKFQHRGAYDDIDSTYDVITAYLDAKGLQVDSPYIEEYLTDLTTADDPNLQVDIYVFMK